MRGVSDFGRNLRFYRERSCLRPYELAAKAGVSAASISRWEGGGARYQGQPRPGTLHRLAGALGVPERDLLRRPESDRTYDEVLGSGRAVAEPGALVSIAETVGGRYSAGYFDHAEDGSAHWHGCVHEPHRTRQEALRCVETRLEHRRDR